MAKYKAYPEYKDSGVEWLGAVPNDWHIIKLKYMADLLTAKPSNPDELFIGLENISSGDGKYISKEETITDCVAITFKKNDILFGKLRPYLAKSWLATFSGVCSSEFLVLRTVKLHPKFLNYYSLTNKFIEQVNSSTYGSKMPRASWGFIGLLPVPTCSYTLSEKIATFLDHETTKIDNLIDKQQQLIELLKEKRQAVISHAVTKGLNPDVPMKASGVEWLGEVPEHWQVLPTKRFFKLITEPAEVNNKHELLSVYSAIGVAPRKELEQKGNKATTTDGYWLVKEGDIIVNKLLAWMGAIGYSNYSGVTSPAYDILRKTKNINPKFYHYLFRLEKTQREFKRWSRGIMEVRLRLYFDELGQINMPVPSKDEQDKIVINIEKLETLYANLEDIADTQIALLKERRTALISAAVSGKIDVRHWRALDEQTAAEAEAVV
ncbi:restriction endonuclease subunit S [Citrobacter freundii]|nr:restriction endonuclease subunit S [Citrobacter freundii]